MQRTDAEIRRLLNKAAQAADADINRLSPRGNIVRRGQISEASKALRATLGLLFADVGDTVKAGRTDAVQAGRSASFDWLEPLLEQAGLSEVERDILRAGAVATTERNVDLMLRRYNTEQIPLSRQVYKTRQLASGWVDRTINAAIGRGATAREIAREVRGSIRPTTPGGVSYAALRLGRTELNNAYHTAAIVENADKPWVQAMEWHLSGSHARRDICDEYAGKDSFGLGDGVFPAGRVPDKPHPNCFCFIVPKLQDEDDFVRSFIAGEYDDVLPAEPERIEVRPKPKEGRAALRAATLDLTDPSLRGNGTPGIDSDRDQLVQYKGVAYEVTNNYLRNGLGSFYRDNIEQMDNIFDRSRISDDVLVWRGIKNSQSIFGDRIDGDLAGMEWIDDAYFSTSADQRIAERFADAGSDGLVMRIQVGKGAPMIRLSEFAPDDEKISDTSAEAEMLGGRGWKMRITRDNGVDAQGRRQVDVEVVSHDRAGRNPWDAS